MARSVERDCAHPADGAQQAPGGSVQVAGRKVTAVLPAACAVKVIVYSAARGTAASEGTGGDSTMRPDT